ncbi:hypothetical protein P7C70_g9454, partial [Phenoliferia sp. Uapishka_3]
SFSIFPSFLGPEQVSWLPNSEGLEVSIGGVPTDPDSPPEPSALQKIAPQLNQLLSDGKTLSIRDPMTEVEMQKHPRVMSWSEAAFENREYIKAHENLVTVEAMMSRIERIPDGVKAISVSLKGGLKIGDGPTLKADLKKKLWKAQKAFEVTRPKWVEELERKESEGREKRKKEVGRP